MLGKKRLHNRAAQTFIEYTLLLGIVVTVLVAMTPIIRRGSQGMVKLVADQIGYQKNSDQPGGLQGHLVNSNTVASRDLRTTRREQLGVTGYLYNDLSDETSAFVSNLGFSKDGN